MQTPTPSPLETATSKLASLQLRSCSYRAPGVYALHLADVVELEDHELVVEADVTEDDADRIVVTCADGMACESAAQWIAANERAVSDAIVGATDRACTVDAWQWAG